MFKKWFQPKAANQKAENSIVTFSPKTYKGQDISIPEDWIVFEWGQSPMHGLWMCHMLQLSADGRPPLRVFIEEMDSPFEALNACCEAIRNKQYDSDLT